MKLIVEDLEAGFGRFKVLDGVSLHLEPGRERLDGIPVAHPDAEVPAGEAMEKVPLRRAQLRVWPRDREVSSTHPSQPAEKSPA